MSTLLLDKFKDWISESSESDVSFQHRSTTILVYGPVQKLYDASTAYGDGFAREVVYQAQLPIYAHLEIITQKFSVMLSIFLQNGPLQQEGYCGRTVLSVGKKDMVLSLMVLWNLKLCSP